MYILSLFKKMLFKKEQPIQMEQSNLFPKTKLIEGENLTTEQTMLNISFDFIKIFLFSIGMGRRRSISQPA
jgi:hypothetical protein